MRADGSDTAADKLRLCLSRLLWIATYLRLVYGFSQHGAMEFLTQHLYVLFNSEWFLENGSNNEQLKQLIGYLVETWEGPGPKRNADEPEKVPS